MRPSPLGLFAASLAFLLPVLVHPSVAGSEWTVRYAALAVVLTVGTVALVNLLRTEVWRPAAVGLAFAAWALVSAVAATNPGMAIWGLIGHGTGALFVLAIAGAWAIGVSAQPGQGAALVERGLVVGALVNVAVAVLQTLVDLRAFDLPLFSQGNTGMDEQAPGLMGNPVFLGGLLAGALWIVLDRMGRRPAPWAAAVLATGTGLQLSGSRIALALAVLALVVARLTKVLPSNPVLVLAAAALAAGLLAGSGVASLRGSVSGTERALAQPVASGGLSLRWATWRTAPAMVEARPVLGHGPNRYREAATPERTFALAQRNPGLLYDDAHNLAVEYAVTTGLPGALLLAGFLFLGFRRARLTAPLGGAAVVLFVVHLLQPQHVALTPLAFLALGAAGRRPLDHLPRVWAPVWVSAGAAGAVAAGILLWGMWHLEEANLDFDVEHAEAAARWLPPWPEPRSLLARIYDFQSIQQGHDPEIATRSRRWLLEATRYDRSDPLLWVLLAESEYDAEQDGASAEHFRRALEIDPWSPRARNGLGFLALRGGNEDEALDHFRRSLLVLPDQPDVVAAVRRLEREVTPA